MRLNSITHGMMAVILALALLSFYGIGCGGDDDDDDIVMDDPTDQPPDDQPPGDQPPGDQPPDDQPPGAAVSYAADIQPIFNANCVLAGCHAPNPPSGLELGSFVDFSQGGVSGPPFKAGNSGDSLIIKRLEGTIQPRMPLDRAALRADQIQDIKDWIDEGGQNN